MGVGIDRCRELIITFFQSTSIYVAPHGSEPLLDSGLERQTDTSNSIAHELKGARGETRVIKGAGSAWRETRSSCLDRVTLNRRWEECVGEAEGMLFMKFPSQGRDC